MPSPSPSRPRLRVALAAPVVLGALAVAAALPPAPGEGRAAAPGQGEALAKGNAHVQGSALAQRAAHAKGAALAQGSALAQRNPHAKRSALVDPSPVRVNQIGYLSGADKIATVVSEHTSPLAWRLVDTTSSKVVATGTSRIHGADRASGDHVHRVDFSAVTAPGTYRLTVGDPGGDVGSVPFAIGGNPLYPHLAREAMQYFYFHRLGTPVSARYLQSPAHAHDALHPGDSSVPCYQDWCGKERLDVAQSWADAGDFGIYPVNHAIAAWTLMNLYERRPAAHGDSTLLIPERGNGRPDLLDEVEYGSRFLSGMLPASGLASHKVHNHRWSAFPVEDVAAENTLPRSAMGPSTNATYAVARTNAQLARVLGAFDADRADLLWASAQEAWKRAEAAPDVDYTDTTPDAEGGGDYADTGNDDDRYAAAAELFLTAQRRAEGAETGENYRTAVIRSPHYGHVADFSWADVATLGTLSLLAVDSDLPAADLAAMRGRLKTFCDEVIAVQDGEGYPAPIPGSGPYPWGSNSSVVNRMLLLGTDYDLTADPRALKAMHRSMDYLMGANAMRLSYVTGYGAYHETDLHDRLAWGRYPATPYPRGWLSGGPNSTLINDTATPTGRPAAKSYAGPGTAPAAWGSKENTVNWNAPLVWAATYLELTTPDLAAVARPGDPAAVRVSRATGPVTPVPVTAAGRTLRPAR
ncbi:glycoside hydrolase family 9 protein [Streptomyces sp. NPDC088261]|uniref:glycoside hydrolase family 9 protein n=1 Tax=Streptomyces sp. NPDC088261 TaxID=3365851 RepID=UPI003803D617